jgi:hypothetical protein
VRLRTNPDDPYIWEKAAEKEHLFSKNISDHSIAALKELYDGVGVSFVAIRNMSTQAGSFHGKVYATNHT